MEKHPQNLSINDAAVQALKGFLDENHLTQRELAAKLTVTPQTVNQVFTGKRALITDTFQNFADALGVEVRISLTPRK